MKLFLSFFTLPVLQRCLLFYFSLLWATESSSQAGNSFSSNCLISYNKTFRSTDQAGAISGYHLMRNNVHLITTSKQSQTTRYAILSIFTEDGQFIKGASFSKNDQLLNFFTRKMSDSTVMLISYEAPGNTPLYTFTLVNDDLQVVWSHSLQLPNNTEFFGGGTYGELAHHMDSEGNFYFVGTRLGYMQNPAFGVYKIDATGHFAWLRVYELQNNSLFGAVRAVSTQGSLILLIEARPSSISVRLDKNTGQILNNFSYAKRHDASSSFRIAKLEKDRIFFAGNTSIDGTTPFYMASFDTTGKPIRTRYLPNEMTIRAAAIKNGFLYASYDHYTGTEMKRHLLKADADLNLVYVNESSAANTSHPAGMDVSDEGNTYVALGVQLDASGSIVNSGSILKYDSEGKLGTCTQQEVYPNIVDLGNQTESFVFTPLTRSYKELDQPVSAVSVSTTLEVDEVLCSSIAQCTSVKLSADKQHCGLYKDYTVQFQMNEECSLIPEWIVDTSFARLINTTQSNSVFRFKKAGTTWIKAKLNIGCTSYWDSVQVSVSEVSPELHLGNDTTICEGSSIPLHAGNKFASYQWNDGTTDSVLIVRKAGIYYVDVTDGCNNRQTDIIEIKDHSPIVFTPLQDRRICERDTVHLNAEGGFINYSWSSSTGFSSANQKSVIINPLINTTYFLRAEKIPNCFIYDTVQISVLTSPLITLGKDTSVCRGDTVLLKAPSGFSSYQWNTGEQSASISIYKEGAYSIRATTVDGCISSDTFKINTLHPLPQPALQQNTTLCEGSTKLLDAGSFQKYLWQDGSLKRTFSANSPGVYYVKVTDEHNCSAWDTTIIAAILPPPSNFLPKDTNLCTYASIKLTAGSNYSNYLWSTGERAANVRVDKAGTYWLTVTDINGCTGRDSITIKPEQCMSGFYIPNAFTPNNDAKNDIYRPLIFGNIKAYRFTIFNRWGGKVFESTQPGQGWNGKNSSVEDKTSVFAWTCEYQLENEEKKMEKGTVTLIR